MIQAKKSIHELTPYADGNHSEYLIKNHTKILKLDSNEPTITPSPKIVEAVTTYLTHGPLYLYPDVKSETLCRKLAHYTKLPENHILTFNGSDHALECIARTFLDKDDAVVIFQPTYDHFRVYAQSCDAKRVNINEQAADTLLKRIQTADEQNIRLVYLVNPNNPTGHTTSKDEVIEAARHYPKTVFLIDEAYYEFCGVSMANLVTEYDNIIVTRSFSKAFGLASVRCGYILAHPNLCKSINKIRVGKNVNALAQVAACAALDDINNMFNYVEEVSMAKNWMIKQFEDKNIPVIKTPANFILFQVKDPENVVDFLERQHIYIRNRSMMTNLKGYIRVTIGNRETMKKFWTIFETVPARWIA